MSDSPSRRELAASEIKTVCPHDPPTLSTSRGRRTRFVAGSGVRRASAWALKRRRIAIAQDSRSIVVFAAALAGSGAGAAHARWMRGCRSAVPTTTQRRLILSGSVSPSPNPAGRCLSWRPSCRSRVLGVGLVSLALPQRSSSRRLLGKPVVLNYHSGEAPDHLRRSAVARRVMRHWVDSSSCRRFCGRCWRRSASRRTWCRT